MEQDASQHILNAVSREIHYNIENYLKIETVDAMKKLYLPQISSVTKDEIKSIFKDAKVEFLNTFPDKITHYYKTDSTPKLYSVVIIPFLKDEIRGIKIIKEVKVDFLKPSGPFHLEIYNGNKIDDKHLIGYCTPDNLPKNFSVFRKAINQLSVGIPENKNISYKIFNFNKEYTKVLIKTSWHLSPVNPYERRAATIIIIAEILLSFFVAKYINTNFINPFLKLSAALKRVKAGDLNLVLKVGVNQKTVRETYNNFNEMVRELKEKEELKSGFIRNLTHDFRTPLLAQERAPSLISKKFNSLNMSEELDLAKSLQKNTSHLLGMVNLILQSYQFNLKKDELHFEVFVLSSFVDESYIKIKPIADKKIFIL